MSSVFGSVSHTLSWTDINVITHTPCAHTHEAITNIASKVFMSDLPRIGIERD